MSNSKKLEGRIVVNSIQYTIGNMNDLAQQKRLLECLLIEVFLNFLTYFIRCYKRERVGY